MTIGFIGCGNMGSAIMSGLLANGWKKDKILASDRSEEARRRTEEQLGIRTSAKNEEIAAQSDIVLLAVKPVFLSEVLAEIGPSLTEDTLVLSIVAGRSLAFLTEALGADKKIVRAMPNTPALIGEGITGFTPNENVTRAEKETVRKILSSFSIPEEVPERLMDVVTAVGGSAPAYVYMFIEAMADAAVLEGMPRDMAYRFAAKTVEGSAKLVRTSGKHPGELKDMVTSPGGTTIEGVRVLEEAGFRGTVMDAVSAAAEKSGTL